ncbi:MAG: hypothetical protein ACI4HI_15760 [Lachnospiraceae bacterium]
MILGSSTSTVFAATKTLSAEKTKTALFPVPEGGYSSCWLKVQYVEKYSYSKSKKKNVFSSRSRFYGYKMAYATTKPSVSMGKIKHYDGNDTCKITFKKYKNEEVLVPGDTYDYCSLCSNSKKRNYSEKTKYYGCIRYMISCDGAFMPSQAGSVKINLKT